MVVETDIQRTIIDAIEKGVSGWAIKMSNAYTNHIPDILAMFPLGSHGTHTMVIEVKRILAMPVRDSDFVKFAHPLTAGQNQTLINIRRAGGRACWWAVYKTQTEDVVYIGLDRTSMPTRTEFIDKCHRRKTGPKGLPWEVFIVSLLREALHLTNYSK
jgi:hypothetical protein